MADHQRDAATREPELLPIPFPVTITVTDALGNASTVTVDDPDAFPVGILDALRFAVLARAESEPQPIPESIASAAELPGQS